MVRASLWDTHRGRVQGRVLPSLCCCGPCLACSYSCLTRSSFTAAAFSSTFFISSRPVPSSTSSWSRSGSTWRYRPRLRLSTNFRKRLSAQSVVALNMAVDSTSARACHAVQAASHHRRRASPAQAHCCAV